LGKDKLATRFPQTCELVREVAQIDITREAVPILPAAHRTIGGIETDAGGRTSIDGLFAVGECACDGLNGAGRLSGNTLTEGLVFGRKVGEAAAAHARSGARKSAPKSMLDDEQRRLSLLTSGSGESSDTPLKLYSELASLMNDKAGLVRDNSSLAAALAQVHALKARYGRIRLRDNSRIYNYQLTSCLEVGSLLNVAELVVMASLARTESRGAHYRSDYPRRNDQQWNQHTLLSRVNGEPRIDTKPTG
jgi:succinate dehydrogenase/fumarate reductase flavoprotein subunit